MAVALVDLLRNFKIKYKIFLIFIVLFLLVIDLGVLTISSVHDIREDTQHISEDLIPRLTNTTKIKDSLNLSILAAYDYVQTGNIDSKNAYRAQIKEALLAEIDLFQRATSEEDFEFTTSFQKYINNINAALSDLIDSYERGEKKEIQQKLATVAERRDEFAAFLEKEIENKIQSEVDDERNATQDRVRRTTMNVIVVGLITIVSFVLIYLFIYRSVTKPVQKLTEAAQDIGRGNFPQVNITTRDELGLFAHTFNDMTQKIQSTQEALKIELTKTKKLDQQKTEFLSIAAHQLRTPMSGIKWSLGMTVEGDFGKLSKKIKKQLQKTLTNTNRMITLINNLLDVTQFDDEKLQYHLEPTDPVEIVRECCADFQEIGQVAKIGVECQSPPTKMPQIPLDKNKITIAIRNIIDNAIKYTPANGTVSVDMEQNKDFIKINIRDTGYGIPDEERDRIFSKFYRGSNIQTVQTEGSGLGLYVAYNIIKKHGGDISFTSKSGIGTTFTILLPKG